MSDELAAAYRDLRTRILERTADLPIETVERVVPCTPAWTVRQLMAHLAGVPADILTGDTENAATEAWADGHVEQRDDRSIEEIRAELAEVGPEVDEVLRAFADAFPPPFFLDAWTHEGDLCHALGVPMSADDRMIGHTLDFVVANVSDRMAAAGVGPIRLVGVGPDRMLGVSGEPVGSLHTDVFEFVRAVMGRRSTAQLVGLDWRDVDGADAGPLLVAWTPNDVDIIETVER